MVPTINYLAVALAVVAAMAVGFAFYHPRVAGRQWQMLTGRQGDLQPAGATTYLVAAVASFVTAWVLAGSAYLSQEFYGSGFLVNSLVTAWILWAGFTAARMLVHNLFDGRSLRLTALTAGHELLAVTAMALVIGAPPPAG